MPSRDSDGIVAAFRRHFSVVEILMIESDLAKRESDPISLDTELA